MEFEKLQGEINSLSATESAGKELDEFESLYFTEITRAHELLNNHTNVPTNMLSVQSSSHGDIRSVQDNEQNNIRLPKIELSTFNGAFDKWLEFHDSFKSMVHNNQKLADI